MSQTTAPSPDVDRLRAEWVGRATGLVDQVAGWAAGEGWDVDRQTETLTERRLGTYDVPAVTLYPPGGEILIAPVALDLLGDRNGRVNVQAIPTFSRVKLVGRPDGSWEVVAGTNIPLRQPWDRETFVRLVSDLLS